MKASPIPETVFDTQLPQLSALLDAAQMGARFARALSIERLTACQITRVKYRPSRNCVISYRLSLTDQRTGHARDHLLSALAMGAGESLPQFISAQQRPLVPTVLGQSIFHLPEFATVVWVFPNDRKLAGLPLLADANHLQNELLPTLVADSFGAEWRINALTNKLVHYVAERSGTSRVDLALSDARTGATMKPALFGKTYCEGEDVAAWQAVSQLWRSVACQRGRLLIPQPLAHEPESRTCWQSGLIGATLNEFASDDAALKHWLAQAGAALAALHETPVSGLTTVTIADVITKLEAAEAVITRAHPSLQAALPDLVNRLIASADRADVPLRATLHGDLHLQNLFVTAGRVALIDLDDLCCGDPLQDLGSFAAALHYRALLDGRSFAATAAYIEQFIAAYRSNVRWEVNASRLAWHTAAALIYERAYRCVTRLKAGRQALLNDIIALAQRLSAH